MRLRAYLTRVPLYVTFTVFELGLGLLALAVGRLLFGDWRWLRLDADVRDLTAAGLLTFPPVLFAMLASSPWGLRFGGFRRIFEKVTATAMGTFIRETRWPGFLMIAVSAGVGEELMFRGVLQPFLGLWLTSLLFGAAHAITVLYFILAAAMGVYLGAIFEHAGACLFPPMVIHAVYDFAALLIIQRRMASAPMETGPDPEM